MTNYVILRRVPITRVDAWEPITAQYARSRTAAVDAIVAQAGAGVYRAVPARAWGPEIIRGADPRRRPVDPNECQEGC